MVPIPVYVEKYKMKNKFIAFVLLIVLAVGFSSCFSSRKSGCPGNPQSNFKFKG